MGARRPTGQGMWIWQISACEGGDVDRIVARATSIGLGHVLIKVANAESSYNEPLDSPLVKALIAAGIEPWAWVYTYPTGPIGEAEWHATQFRADAFAGLIVDAEVEYKGHRAEAAAYAKRLRELLPTATLGFTSYQFPTLHPTLPWREFLSVMDINLPQVYWYTRDPVESLRRALRENAAYGVPIMPLGAAYPDAATAAGMELFSAECRAQGINAWSWWDWQHCTAAMWRVIAQQAGGTASAPVGLRPLAVVAAEAPTATWMRESAVVSDGKRYPLLTSTGWCAGWAGEVLAHAFDPTAGANARHGQTPFRFNGLVDTADHWGDYLAAGGDGRLGQWVSYPLTAGKLQPGDMLFWRGGVNGYSYAAGHVAIVTAVNGSSVQVSENSSSRGIGTHPLPAAALANAAGLMRWDLPQEDAPPAPRPDVAPWAQDAAKRLQAAGIITGDPDGRLRGFDAMTRNELFVALDRALNG